MIDDELKTLDIIGKAASKVRICDRCPQPAVIYIGSSQGGYRLCIDCVKKITREV